MKLSVKWSWVHFSIHIPLSLALSAARIATRGKHVSALFTQPHKKKLVKSLKVAKKEMKHFEILRYSGEKTLIILRL